MLIIGLVGLGGVGAAFGLSARAMTAPGDVQVVTSDTTVVFGPKQFQASPQTAIYVEQFTEARDLEATYVLRVENGNADGSARVSDAEVWFNGVQILKASDFSTSVYVLTRGLSIQDGENILEVRVKGQNSRYVTVRVLRIRSEAIGLYSRRFQKETSGPETFADQFSVPEGYGSLGLMRIRYGEEGGTYVPTAMIVVLNGDTLPVPPPCDDPLGCFDCIPEDPDCGSRIVLPVTLSSENHIGVELDGALGSSARIHVMVFDTAGPVIDLHHPAEGLVTALTEVEVSGTVTDQTPPIILTVNGDTIPVGEAGEFSAIVTLQDEGENVLLIRAQDSWSIEGIFCVEYPGPMEVDPMEPDSIGFPGPLPIDELWACPNATELTRVVIRDTEPPALVVTSPPDGLVTSDPSVVVAGTVQDLTEAQVNVNGVPLVVDGTGAFSGEVLLDEGENFLTITATDQAGNSSSTVRHVTRTGGDPDPPVLVVTEPADGLVTTAAQVWVRGTVTGVPPVTVTVNGAGVAVEPDDSFEHEVALLVGPNPIVVIATDGNDSTTSVTRNVTREAEGDPDLPPDPSTVAPELDRTVSTTLQAATEFLYTGENPIQTGVLPGTISAVRASVIRGRVLTRTGEPLPGVTITVLNHPEFGQTLSRADGAFDLAVNGGGQLTLNYEKNGYLPAQRLLDVPWQLWAHAEDVVLLGLDPEGTVVSPAVASEVQVARGSEQTDADGSRQATVFFKPGTVAEMVMPDGSRVELQTLTVRATEYTVGENGPEAMPGPLPPTVAYTYAVELSVDEAVAAGATGVEFSQPVAYYVENFLGFPVGMPVPVAWWDRQEAAWIPAPDGRIVQILSVDGGLADVDVTGDGLADSEAALLALGIDAGERQTLAMTYAPGTTLWRAETTHFSPLDLNWPIGCGPDCTRPWPDLLRDMVSNPCAQTGSSIIECENQVLGESFSVAGTPFTLNYRSDRANGRAAGRTFDVIVSGPDVPQDLLRIEVVVEVAGRRFSQTFPAEPNQAWTFAWDGLDAFGREMHGSTGAVIRVGYVYPFYYTVPASLAQSFGLSCRGAPGEPWATACIIPTSVNSAARQEEVLWQQQAATMRAGEGSPQALGAWTLDIQHAYDPASRMLHLGSGDRVLAEVGETITNFAGTGLGTCGYWNEEPNCQGDGGPATEADFAITMSAAVGPDGSVYVSEWDGNRIRRIHPDGTISTVAGNGDWCNGFYVEYDPEVCGDNIPATEATLSFPHGVAVGPDGVIYFVELYAFRIRRVGLDGIITTVAGQNVWCSGDRWPECGDGGPASEAHLSWYASALAFGPDGSLYLADSGLERVRRIGPDGIIHTVAGKSEYMDWEGDGGPATDATIGWPDAIALDKVGSLYITDSFGFVRRVAPDGVITTIAGDGSSCSPDTNPCGDGGPALDASLYWWMEGIAVGADGSVFVSMTGNDRVRRIWPDGTITAFAGSGVSCWNSPHPCGDGGYAAAGQLDWPHGLATGPDGEIYIADTFESRVRRVASTLPGFSGEAFGVTSEDGSERYQFNSAGLHLRTLNALTGEVLYSFGYDAQGLLESITDADGLVTTIERDGSGVAVAIHAPFGQRTDFAMDAGGYLATITNPAGEAVELSYGPGGLLTGVRDPRGNSSSYDYDDTGRLILASDPAGGSKSLVRSQSASEMEVAVTTALGRTTTYRVTDLSSRGQQRSTTRPDGFSTVTTMDTRGGTVTELPDGTVTTRVEVGDPRFGLQAPVVSEFTVATPGGGLIAGAASRRAILANPGDASSLVTQLDSVRLNGRTFTSLYDASLRAFTSTTPQGRQRVVRIDSIGRVVEDQVPGIAATGYTYDGQGFLTSMSQGGRTWTYGYDALGRLASVTDPLSRTDSLFYDAADRLVRQVLPNGSEILYGYDAAGNLTSLTPPGRSAHGFDYTAVHLDSVYAPPSAGAGNWTTEYRYDLDRQLTQVLRPDGQVIDLGYDAAGRLNAVTTPAGAYSYGYSALTGQLESVTGPGSGTLSYTYDGFLPRDVTWSGAVSGTVTVRYDNNLWVTAQRVNGDSIPFGYDNDGLLTSAGALSIARSPQNGLITGSNLGGLATRWTYNSFGELASDTARHGGTVLYRNAYTRDDLGRITGKVETIEGVTTTYAFTYDSIGRLELVTRDGSPVESYTYDPNGNRISFTGPGGTLVGSYDDQDRLLSYGDATYTYTANGELTSRTTPAGTTTYDYDVLGNLRGVLLPDGTAIEYIIDGQNRRVGKQVDGVLAQGFLYQDQLNPVAELDGTGQVVNRFVYGTRPHVPDYLVSDGVMYRLVTDHLGSVRLVVDIATGTVAQRIDYDAFGRVTQNSNPGFQPFGFAGGIYDDHTGLVRFGARDYDVFTGRWTAKDPIGFAGGSSNLYAYALEDPVNWVDPYGTQGIPGAIAGAVAGGLGGYITGGWRGAAAGTVVGAGVGAVSAAAAAHLARNAARVASQSMWRGSVGLSLGNFGSSVTGQALGNLIECWNLGRAISNIDYLAAVGAAAGGPPGAYGRNWVANVYMDFAERAFYQAAVEGVTAGLGERIGRALSASSPTVECCR